MYAAMLKKLYTGPLIAVLVFSALFICVGGVRYLRRPSPGTVNESAHNFLLILVNGVLAAFVFGNLTILSTFIFQELSLPRLSPEVWTALPAFVVFVVVLLALDFQNYWAHRVLHTKHLWGIHALHHSDAHMTWTTSYRIHIFEWVVMTFVFTTLLGWATLPPELVATAGMIRNWHSKLIHCQLGWNFGLLRKIIVSPNYHRWHHSIQPEAYGKNLCDMFPIWDIMFGTYYDPGQCETELGITDGPEGFLQGQLYPISYAASAIKRRLPLGKATPPQTP